SRRRHTRFSRDWSSDVCSSDLTFIVTEWGKPVAVLGPLYRPLRDAAAIDHLTALGHAVPPAAPLTDTLMDAGQPTDLTGAIRKADRKSVVEGKSAGHGVRRTRS